MRRPAKGTGRDAHTTRLLLLASIVSACGGLPGPVEPLVATPQGATAPIPPPAQVEPPAFPRVSEHRLGPHRLWYERTRAHRGVIVRVETRRGEDGAYSRGLVGLTTAVLVAELESRIPAADVIASADIHGAAIEIRLDERFVGVALRALAEVLDGAPPDASRVTRVRQHHFAGLARLENSPTYAAIEAARAHLRGMPGGIADAARRWRQDMDSVGTGFVTQCRNERFAPEDRVVIVTGEFEPRTLRAHFDEAFDANAPARPRLAGVRVGPVHPEHAALSLALPTPQAHAVYARNAPAPRSDDRLAFELLVDLLGGAFGSSLNSTLREQHGYTYGAHATIDARAGRDMVTIRTSLAPASIEPALVAFFDQLRHTRQRLYSSVQIESARNRLWASVRARLDGEGRAALFGSAWTQWRSPAALAARYAALGDVRADDLLQVARRYLDPQDAVLVLVGDFSRVSGFIVERNAEGFTLREDD